MKRELNARSAFLMAVLYPILGVIAALLARLFFGGGDTAQREINLDQVIGAGIYGTMMLSVVLIVISIYVFQGSRRDIYFERKPFTLSRLYYFYPLAWAGVAVVALFNVDFSVYSPGVIARVIIAALAIAVNEEIVTRGILLVGLRNSRFAEWQAWLITLLIFSLYHLVNVLGGGSLTIVFIVATGGTLLYIARRVFNNLFASIGLHAFYDTAFFLLTGSYAIDESLPDHVLDLQLGSFLVLLGAAILFLVFGRKLLRNETTGWENTERR